MASDSAKGKAEETVHVTITAVDVVGNPEPAYESGPHLRDPDIRALKRAQMEAYGWQHDTDEPGLTKDMRKIMQEKA